LAGAIAVGLVISAVLWGSKKNSLKGGAVKKGGEGTGQIGPGGPP